jgi:ADP-heptose:LPS heptosyltransferase
MARDLGVPPDQFIWEGKCIFEIVNKSYDVVLMDGYNPNGSANWSIKSYPYYSEVVKLLKNAGLSVCSIGKSQEYVPGTMNETGRSLLSSFGLIRNSKVLLCNDTGMYHAANALDTKNVAIFTATSTIKNYDKRFHKYANLVYKDDLVCRSCQAQQRWRKDCEDWGCREIDPKVVFNTVMETIKRCE